MAWETESKRRAELPPDWAKRQAKCIRDAGGRCQQHLAKSHKRCPRRATDADHRSDPSNHDDLQALCGFHHAQKTAREARAGKAAIRARGRRKPERHPAG